MNKLMSALAAGVLVVAVAASGCSKGSSAQTQQLTPEQAKQKVEEGTTLVQSGKYEDAGKALESVVSSQPQQADAKTYIMLGITRYQKKDYAGALDAYDKAISLDPKIADAYQGKANVYRDQKDLKNAEIWYRKAWAADPKYVDAYTELALQLGNAKRVPDAISVLQEGVKNNPSIYVLDLMLGNFYMQNGQKNEAKSAYEAAYKLNPNNPDVKKAYDSVNTGK